MEILKSHSTASVFRHDPRLALGVIIGYVGLALFSLVFQGAATGFPLIWLSTAFSVILVYANGSRVLGALCLGALTGHSLIAYQAFGLGAGQALLQGTLTGIVYTFQAWLIWYLYKKFTTRHFPLDSDHGLRGFLWSLFLACGLSAVMLLLLDFIFAIHNTISIEQRFTTHLLANSLAVVAFVPPYLMTRRTCLNEDSPLSWLEIGLWLSSLGAIWYGAYHQGVEILFLLIPLLIWSATRFRLLWNSYANAALTLVSVTCTSMTFHSADLITPTTLHLMEGQLLVLLAVSLYIAILLSDRSRIEGHLEELVSNRTQQLETINQELQDEIYIRKQAERSFRTSSRRYRALIETAGSPIIVLDREYSIKQWNSAAEKLFGYYREDIVGKNYIQCFVPGEFQDETAWKIMKVLEVGLGRESIESDVVAFDGSRHTMLWNINRVADSEEELSQAIMIGQDITEIRETQNQLQYLAHYDVLTDTANRRLFEDRCRQALKQASRNQNTVGLISLDLDHFKKINDTLGHDAGDELLKQISRRLKSCVRREDTVARLGGDEFAVLLPNVNGPEGCEHVAKNLLNAIIRPVDVPGRQLSVTTSIGITLAPDDGNNYQQLLKNADMAMYRAKKSGRNNFQFYQKEMNEELLRQVNMENELRSAIKKQQFRLYYLPVIDLENLHVVGLEALIRWQHPQRGTLHPHEFLEVAEQSGLLTEMGDWVINNACLQGKLVHAMNRQPVQIAVNLSARHFQHPQLVSTLRQAFKQNRFDPKYMALEINESALISNPVESSLLIQEIKTTGASVTIDSFGSGLSSLSHLARLPIDAVKVDRAFTRHIPHDPHESALTETLLTIARKMNLQVIAEGVETQAQENFFRNHGCRYVQGHYYSEPVCSEDLPTLFKFLRQGEFLHQNGQQIRLPLQ